MNSISHVPTSETLTIVIIYITLATIGLIVLIRSRDQLIKSQNKKPSKHDK